MRVRGMQVWNRKAIEHSRDVNGGARNFIGP